MPPRVLTQGEQFCTWVSLVRHNPVAPLQFLKNLRDGLNDVTLVFGEQDEHGVVFFFFSLNIDL